MSWGEEADFEKRFTNSNQQILHSVPVNWGLITVEKHHLKSQSHASLSVSLCVEGRGCHTHTLNHAFTNSWVGVPTFKTQTRTQMDPHFKQHFSHRDIDEWWAKHLEPPQSEPAGGCWGGGGRAQRTCSSTDAGQRAVCRHNLPSLCRDWQSLRLEYTTKSTGCVWWIGVESGAKSCVC